MRDRETHGADGGHLTLRHLGHRGAGHGGDGRVGAITHRHSHGGGDLVAIAVEQGKARLEQAVGTALIQRLMKGKAVFAIVAKGQLKHQCAIGGMPLDTMLSHRDGHGLLARGEPLQPRLIGIEGDADQRIAARRDGQIARQSLALLPVAIFGEREGDWVYLRQGTIGNGDIEGTEVALVAVKIAALYLQAEVEAVGRLRLVKHTGQGNVVFAIQPDGDGEDRLALPILDDQLVILNLVTRRLALAGEPHQRRLAGLKVEGDQTIAAHRHRQLTIDALVAPFLQRDALVDAQCGITAIIDGQGQVGAGAVAIDLVGAYLQTEGKRVAPLMIERAGEGDHHPPSQIAVLLLRIQFGAQHLHPLATAIQVVTHQGAITGKFKGQRMAIAGKTRAVEGSQGAALITEH